MVQFINPVLNLASGFVHGLKNWEAEENGHSSISFDINDYVAIHQNNRKPGTVTDELLGKTGTTVADTNPIEAQYFTFNVMNTFSYGTRLLGLGTFNLTLTATGLFVVTQVFWKYGKNSNYEALKSMCTWLVDHSDTGLWVTRIVTAVALFGMGHYLFVAGSVLSYGLTYNENKTMRAFAHHELVDTLGGMVTSVGLFKEGSLINTIIKSIG